MNESILSKIRKLQNLTTERGATPEEAASAAAKAQALLFEHNLQQTDIETHEAAPDPYGRVEHALEHATRTSVQWRRTLLYAIAINNFCTAVTLPNTTKMSVIGKRSNVETVLYLNQCIARQIEALADQASRHQLTNRAAYHVSFCRGAVATMYHRLGEQRRQGEHTATQTGTAEQGNRNALTIRTASQDLNAAIAKFHPRLRTTTSRVRTNDAYRDGRAAGANISTSRGIGSSGRPAGYLP